MGLEEAERHVEEFAAVRKQLRGSGVFYEVLSLHLNTCFIDGQVSPVLEPHLNISEQALMFAPHRGE